MKTGKYLMLIAAFSLFFFLVPCSFLSARDTSPGFFIAPLAEVSGYGREGLGYGGGLTLGMGDGVSIGFRLLYTGETGEERINALELAIFIRFYPFSSNVPIGLFFQIESGAVIISPNGESAISSEKKGSFVAGIAVGWRFPFGSRWYIEPAIRAGYPFIAGAGVSIGFRL